MTTQQKKKALRKTANGLWKEACIKIWGLQCQVCFKMAGQVHHYYPKGAYGHLRLDTDNGIPICQGCHMRHHSAADPRIHQTIDERRGIEWVERIKKKAKNRIEWDRVWWFEEQIAYLKTVQRL